LDANSDRILLFDPVAERFLEPPGEELRTFSLPNYVRYAFWDSRGTFWIGTRGNGLFQYLPETDKLIHHNSLPGNRRFSDYRVNVIFEDRKQRIWVGGEEGIFILNPQDGRWDHYDQSDGLSDNIVAGIVQDSSGHIWVSTFNGLNSFDYEGSKQFGRYYSNDGLSHDEFNRFSFHIDRLGNLIMGTINGFNVIHPQDLITDRVSPMVKIDARICSRILIRWTNWL
jgi:streptogramin lyase